jgi:hypothetical protein
VGSPVFNDTTGSRVSAIKWGSRIFLVLVLLLVAALAFTLRSHVTVPGLERLVPGLDAREVRPVPRTESSNPPVEQAKIATEPGAFRARPSTRPTGRAAGTQTDAARPAETRRTVGPTTGPTAAEPSSAPAVAPTRAAPTGSARHPSATPTVPVGGPETEKTRNPKAATPTPGKQQAPGQTRRPKPKPTTDLG